MNHPKKVSFWIEAPTDLAVPSESTGPVIAGTFIRISLEEGGDYRITWDDGWGVTSEVYQYHNGKVELHWKSTARGHKEDWEYKTCTVDMLDWCESAAGDGIGLPKWTLDQSGIRAIV